MPSGLAYEPAFLGPRAETADEMERLLPDVLRDHVFWRRNLHPDAPRFVHEPHRADPAFAAASARLRDELFQILVGLKRAAPLHSPGQIAPIVSTPRCRRRRRARRGPPGRVVDKPTGGEPAPRRCSACSRTSPAACSPTPCEGI